MFKTPALAMASFLLLAAPAVAQRGAPITQGTTSLDLADQISQARQLSADTKVQVNALSSDLMTLTGRVETLEFQLQQARNENETLVNDNEALAREINALKSELRAQSRAIQDLQARSLGMDPPEGEAATGLSDYPGAASTDPYESAGAAASAPSQPSVTGSMSRTATVEPETTGPKRLLPRTESGAPEETAAIDTTPPSAVPPGAPQTRIRLRHDRLTQFGFRAVENRVHVHDLHATILKLMGFDHEQLTYRYAGRNFRLTDVHGNVVDALIG